MKIGRRNGEDQLKNVCDEYRQRENYIKRTIN